MYKVAKKERRGGTLYTVGNTREEFFPFGSGQVADWQTGRTRLEQRVGGKGQEGKKERRKGQGT